MLEPFATIWGYALSPLELAAVLLALACVVLEVLEIHWAWPLAIVSSLLYGWLFEAHRLYGEAGLQLFFVLISVWGWSQWLRGRRRGAAPDPAPTERLHVVPLAARHWPVVLVVWAAGWLLLSFLLASWTDTDVPRIDAFVTAGSIVGTLLMARKLLAAWPVLLIVNVAAAALFGYKLLYLTALLYVLFCLLSLIGWRRWRQQLARQA